MQEYEQYKCLNASQGSDVVTVDSVVIVPGL